MLNWKKLSDEKPKDQQQCLVKMKHGIVEGCYDATEETFSIYLWTDITFYGTSWVPIEEAE